MALAAADLSTRDGGAAALVRRYAALIDHAAQLSAEADVLWELADGDDAGMIKAIGKLRLAVDAQSVVSDLGPKLLAGLTALGCTLAGRGEQGKEVQRAPDPRRAAHDELRERRAARKHNTPA